MNKSGINTLTMKDFNVQLIQSCIYEKGPISRIDISSQINASTATVSRIVEDLQSRRIVRSTGTVDNVGAGRKADLLEFNYQYGSVIGVYIRERSVDVAVSDLRGDVSVRKQILTRSIMNNDGYLDALIALIHEVLALSKVERLMAIGVACFGLVDPERGTLMRSIALPYRNGLPIAKRLGEEFRVPVYLENDVNMAVLGEYSRRKSGQSCSMAYIEFGAGVGAGILIDGKLYRGHALGAGEIAYMLTDKAQLYESHTENGCLEESICLDRIEKNLDLLRMADPSIPSGCITQQELEYLLALYEKNTLAQHLIDGIISNIAFAVCNYACILNPELIVLGGDYADAWGSFLIQHVEAAVTASYPLAPRIELSKCESDPELIGAVESAIWKLVNTLYLEGKEPHRQQEFIRPR